MVKGSTQRMEGSIEKAARAGRFQPGGRRSLMPKGGPKFMLEPITYQESCGLPFYRRAHPKDRWYRGCGSAVL